MAQNAKNTKDDKTLIQKQSKDNSKNNGQYSEKKVAAEKNATVEKRVDTERKTDDIKKKAVAEKRTVTMKKRSRNVAGILAIMTGAIGLHKFYLGQWKKGIFYVLFFWTGIPGLLGLLEGAHLLGSDAEPEQKAVPTKDVTVRA